MKSSNFGYIPALDHLRGFAALLVLFFHGCHLITHKLQSDVAYNLSFWPLAENPFTSLIIEGHTAVSLFYLRYFEEIKKFDVLALLGLLLVVTALVVFNQLGGNGSNNGKWAMWPTIEASCWAIFVIGYLSFSRRFPAWLGKLLVALGTVSYSVYLVHYLVHYVVLDYLMGRDWAVWLHIADPFGTALLNTTFIIMPLVVLISTATYWIVERPFLARRRTYMAQAHADAQA